MEEEEKEEWVLVGSSKYYHYTRWIVHTFGAIADFPTERGAVLQVSP